MVLEPTRTVIIYDESGVGKDGSFKEVKKGMVFRIMESDGLGPVKDEDGNDVFFAEGDAYIDTKNDIWTVEISAYTGNKVEK